jgi:hypothetical protein
VRADAAAAAVDRVAQPQLAARRRQALGRGVRAGRKATGLGEGAVSISAIASAVDRATYSFVESAGSTRPAAPSSAVICWTTAPAWSVTTMSRNEEPGSAPLVSSAVVGAVVEAVAVAVPARATA